MYTNKLKNKSEIVKNISLVLFGDFGTTEKISPKICETGKCSDGSLKDDLIHFHLKKPHFGQIFKIKLIYNHAAKHKNSEFNWYLKSIEVDYHKEKYQFIHKKWIANSRNEKKSLKLN